MSHSHWSAVPTPLFDNTAAACLLHLPVVEGLIFCISVTPHLGTSFPLFHGKEDFSFTRVLILGIVHFPHYPHLDVNTTSGWPWRWQTSTSGRRTRRSCSTSPSGSGCGSPSVRIDIQSMRLIFTLPVENNFHFRTSICQREFFK